MATLAENEIGNQIESIRNEWKATIHASQDEKAVPEGISKAEVDAWKDAQKAAAKKRLSELEERLQRLQMLRSKLQRLRATADETLKTTPAGWDLPNGVNGHLDNTETAVKVGGNGMAQWAVLEDDVKAVSQEQNNSRWGLVDTPETVFRPSQPHQTAMAAYSRPPPPLTPGLSAIRKIVREEMDETIGKIESNKAQDGIPVAVAINGHQCNGDGKGVGFVSVPDFVEASTEHPHQDAVHNAGPKPAQPEIETRSTTAVHAFHDKGKKEIKSLDDAVPVSCPLWFGGFTRRSPVRIKCLQIYNSKAWMTFFLIVTILNCILIAAAPELKASSSLKEQTEGTQTEPRTDYFLYFDYCCVGILTFEVLCGIIALGFIKDDTSWLRISDMHVLEFIVLLGTLFEYLAAYYGLTGLTLVPFRLLRILKVLIYSKIFLGIKTIIASLREGFMQLIIVFMMFIFFLAAFGIFGMVIWGSSFRRRCVWSRRMVPKCSSDFSDGWNSTCNMVTEVSAELDASDVPLGERELVVTGGYPFERWCKILKNSTAGEYDDRYPLDSFGRYHTCQLAEFRKGLGPINQTCESLENPSYTFSHFDHIGGALLSLFQGGVPDSYYDIIHRSKESEPQVEAIIWIYYIMLSCLITFLLLGLFVAVVTGTFKRIREQHGTAFLSQEGDDAEMENQIWKSFRFTRKTRGTDFKSIKSAGRAKMLTLRGEQDVDEMIQAWCRELVVSNNFWTFLSCAILVHCIAMASDQWNSPQGWRDYSSYTYYVCNFIFLAEWAIRFFAAGQFEVFWSRHFHKMETFLNLCGIVGLAWNNKFLLLIPAFRLYRLMRYVPTLENLLLSALGSVRAFVNLLIFVSVVGCCFVITGRYVFGDKMNEVSPRANFGTFSDAALTIFQLLIGDSWSSVLYSAMASMEGTVSEIFAAVFVLSWFLFGVLIVNNLFVAVIIENFEVSETIADIAEPGHIAAFRDLVRNAYGRLWSKSRLVHDGHININPNTGSVSNARDGGESTGDTGKERQHGERYRRASLAWGQRRTSVVTPIYKEESEEQIAKRREKSIMYRICQHCTIPGPVADEIVKVEKQERVLYLFKPGHPVRVFFAVLAHLSLFEGLVFCCIMVSCAFLTLTPPAEDIPDFYMPISAEDLKSGNQVFTFVFTVEFVVRVMDQGLIFTERAYLKSGWNFMDFTVLAFSWVDETNVFTEGNYAKVLRLARALRPLRLMKRNQGMRVVIDALIGTLAPVGYVIMFSLFTFAVFGVIGMGLFGGRLYSCSTPGADYPSGRIECSGLYIADNGVLFQRSWLNPSFSFDTFTDAFFTLFQVNTVKYVAIAAACMDITDLNVSPSKNHSGVHALFFVLYLIIGALFVMNLFVGFIVDGFNASKGTNEEELYYNRFIRQLHIYKPKYSSFTVPQNRVSELAREFMSSNRMVYFSAFCVFINIGFMLADHEGASGTFAALIEWQNMFFFLELVFEVMLNLVGYGPGGFWDDSWKGFDMFVALGTAAGYAASSQQTAQFAKTFRFMRVFRLMKVIKPIRVILETLVASMSQLANILLLLFLVYSIFGVVAIQLFGVTKFGQRLGPTASFGNYQLAMATIYQMVTGDEWHTIMSDCSISPPYCTPVFSRGAMYGDEFVDDFNLPDYKFGDCGSPIARYYFLIFKLVCENVMLNLFIGMILDNFSFITDEVAEAEDDTWSKGASSSQVMTLSEKFKRYDKRTGSMPITSLHGLMMDLPAPLGFRDHDGNVKYGQWEQATEQLIRADLNITVRAQVTAAREAQLHGWRKYIPISDGNTSKRYLVDFVDVIRIILYWRKPEMVPEMIKATRKRRLEETLLMAYALIMTDTFLRAMSVKKRERVLRKLQNLTDFRKWEQSDPYRLRRKELVLANRIKEKNRAAKERKKIISYFLENNANRMIDFDLLDAVPEDMLEHPLLTKKLAKVIKPMHGLEVFRKMAQTHLVVLKFADSRHQRLGHVTADFTETTFTGWEMLNLEHDTYFSPRMHKNILGDEETAIKGWEKVAVVMKAGKSFSNREKLKNMGCIQDLHAYIVTSGRTRAEKIDNATSVVRLNLGDSRWDELVRGEQDLELMKKQDHLAREALHETVPDVSVAEVVGYLPHGMALQLDTTKIEEKSKELADTEAESEELVASNLLTQFISMVPGKPKR